MHEQFYQGQPPKRMWLTVGDVARRLAVTRRWVNRLARAGELLHVVTESGQRIFRRDDVLAYAAKRMDARAGSRPAQLRAIRCRMLKAGIAPRQLPLFGPRLTLIRTRTGSERSVPDREVKAARSFDVSHGSSSRSYVDRKVGGGRR